jgi:HK97 family phage prohead protease
MASMQVKPIRLGNHFSSGSEFAVLKGTGKDLIIAGYASVDVVDKQNDLITLDALAEAAEKFMKSDYKNVMITHSNVQVGEVIDSYTDTKGNLLKTGCDDTGFFVVIKMRNDIEKAKEVARDIRKGKLRSFSIGGQAMHKHNVHDPDIGTYKEIDKLELHEITICEEGINPEAKFEIVKENKNKGSEKMTDEISKALGEFEDIVAQLRNQMILKDDADEENMAMPKDEEKKAEEEMMSEEEMIDDEEDMSYKAEEEDDVEGVDDEAKAADSIVYGHNATGQKMGESNLTGRFDSEYSEFLARKAQSIDTLDLSEENVAKAYAQFKAEKEEARAYDVIKNEFEARYQAELKAEANMIAKEKYDASAEVKALKNEFAELRKSLESSRSTIAKQVTEATTPTGLSEDVIAKMNNVGDLSWEELNDLVREVL